MSYVDEKGEAQLSDRHKVNIEILKIASRFFVGIFAFHAAALVAALPNAVSSDHHYQCGARELVRLAFIALKWSGVLYVFIVAFFIMPLVAQNLRLAERKSENNFSIVSETLFPFFAAFFLIFLMVVVGTDLYVVSQLSTWPGFVCSD